MILDRPIQGRAPTPSFEEVGGSRSRGGTPLWQRPGHLPGRERRGAGPDDRRLLPNQRGQTALLGQPHDRLQPAVRDQVRVVERG